MEKEILYEEPSRVWTLRRVWNHYRMALLVLIILSAAAQRIWITWNQAPPEHWDDVDHLTYFAFALPNTESARSYSVYEAILPLRFPRFSSTTHGSTGDPI